MSRWRFNHAYRTDFEDVVDGKVISLEQQFLMKTAKDGIDDAQMWYMKTHPRKAAGGISMEKLTKLFYQEQNLQTKMITTEEIPPFKSLEEFNLTPELQKWVDNEYQPTLVLYGEGGTGKTSFARALAFQNNFKMLMVNHRDDFKKYDFSYNLIVFDDFQFNDLNRDQVLAALDSKQTRTINVKNGHVTKKGGLPHIVAINPTAFTNLLRTMIGPDWRYNDLSREFGRRMSFVEVDNNFIKKQTSSVEIQLSIKTSKTSEVSRHNDIFNNDENVESNRRKANQLLHGSFTRNVSKSSS